jgi:SpoVK/Ycf46/Vps4 family AAA+-type ATPase
MSEKTTSHFKSFNYLENGEILFSQYATIKSGNKVDAGSYDLSYLNYPESRIIFTVNDTFESSKTHNYPDKEKLEYLFESFFNKDVQDKIEGLGFCHKIGVLLWGKEGTGKSTIMKYYYTKAIHNEDALVFHLNNTMYLEKCWEFVQNVRKIQDNPIIIVFDEFDKMSKDNEALLKTIIDGNKSISNCIFFAATNYIDKIPHALKDRPSRFKYSIEIKGMQNYEDVIEIITPILDGVASDEDIQIFAHELQDKTLDYIKQFCFDKIMSIKHYENSAERKKVGFLEQ